MGPESQQFFQVWGADNSNEISGWNITSATYLDVSKNGGFPQQTHGFSY